MRDAEPGTFEAGGGRLVSRLLLVPDGARILYVLAHGAGVGMEHRAMEEVAWGLAGRGMASFRYNFPYMEQGGKRPDPPALCHAVVRAAVAEAGRLAPGLPLVAGGRSFGGRMTSQAQALAPLPAVLGLIFLAFPLHPAGQPGRERAKHLFDVQVPMLFLQGTRDALADVTLLRPLCAELGGRATLETFEDADHSFKLPARSGRTNAEVLDDVLDRLAAWAAALVDLRR